MNNYLFLLSGTFQNECIKLYNKGYSILEIFAWNGARQNNVIRGFPCDWDQALSNAVILCHIY